MDSGKMIHCGKWYNEFDENGGFVAAGYDASYNRLLGYEEGELVVREFGDWAARIHPDDRERVLAYAMDVCGRHPEGMDYDVELRLMTRWGYRWFHDYGLCTRRGDGSLARCDGVVFDIQEIVDREDDSRRLAENYSRFFALEDSFESLYDVELESGHYEFFVKGSFYRNNVIDKLSVPGDYFEELRGNIDAVIYGEDRDGLYRTLTREGIRRELAEADHFDYYYRLNTENGPLWFKMRIVYKDASKRNVIIGVFNAEGDVAVEQLTKQKEQLSEALTFTNFFLDTYVSAYYVNFGSLSCQVYKRTRELEEDYPIVGNYLDSITDYINRDVHPEDRELLLETIRPENMKAALRERQQYSHIFRDVSGSVEKYYRMQVIRGADEDHAAFGFIDITDEVNEQNERVREADEAKKLVESVAAAYDVAYAVNMEDDSYKLLKAESAILTDGRRFADFSEAKESFLNFVHFSDRERMRRELDYGVIRAKLKDRHSYSLEFRVLQGDTTSWHEMKVTLIDEGRVALGFADRDLELTKLHLENQRFEENFALFTVDLDTGMLKVVLNEQGFRPVPVGASAPYGETIRDLAYRMEGEARDFFLRISDIDYVRTEFTADSKRTFSYRSIHLEDGQWIDVTSYVILRHEDGSPAMFTIGFSVVDALATVRQELQNRFAEQNARLLSQQKELEDARSAAEAANKAKTDFLFSMSHDIRTPMNAITGFTNMAVKHIDDREKVLDCLEKTQRSGAMLLSLINSVLEVSRIEAGHATVEEQYGDIYYSFIDIDHTMLELAKTKDIDLSFEYGEIRNRFVFADFSRCMRVFVNVISNAIKYTPAGGRVKVRCEQVGEAVDGVATYRHTVSDNGIGMSEEFQKHVFDQFSREKTATVSGIQGSGLGMSVVKSFVELMGGTVSVSSRQGEGTTFTILLPLKLQEGESYTDPVTGEVISFKQTPKKLETADFTGKLLLLVEDNELNREIAEEMLEDEGFLVETAEDGSEAVAILDRKGPDYYDFILMDIQMPVMNGYEATKAIRAMFPESRIPIIALSANAFAEDKAASIAAGMDDHVAKPINVRGLFTVLARYL